MFADQSAVSTWAVRLTGRQWLSRKTFEAEFSCPPGFAFTPGQYIRSEHEGLEREYSLASVPGEAPLKLCIRDTRTGNFSSALAHAEIGSPFTFTGPHGYFVFQPSPRNAVFVATGTGIAPFVSMARSGIGRFTLLHGVQTAEDLYYAPLFRASAEVYVPYLSESDLTEIPSDAFCGRVTDYLEKHLSPGTCDFYLCGRRKMIWDVTFLADDRFPGSRVYSESFY